MLNESRSSGSAVAEQLRNRSKHFVQVIRFCRSLPNTAEAQVISRQLLRSSTSVAANYRAVCRSRSRAEFVSRLAVVVEESDESGFWLELLIDAEVSARKEAVALLKEADELTAIFNASRSTARNSRNQNSGNQNS
jgi:four helix bundle protein